MPADMEDEAVELELDSGAVTRLRELIAEEDNSELKLRVFVSGGGCAGFQYGFAFDEECAEDDAVLEQDGVMVLVDAMSYQYLVGSKIGHKEDLMGAKFFVDNPNATTTCGCGSSFTI